MVFDQFSDPTFQHIFKLACEYPAALHLAEKADIDFEKNAQRANAAFAWQDRRLFPIDSPEQAVLSRLYMEKQAAVPDEARQQCDKSLELYGVKLDLTEKVASAPVSQGRSAEEVSQTADAFVANNRVMNVEEKAKLAATLVKEAVDLGVPLPALVLRSAGTTMMDSSRLKDWIEARKEASDEPLMKEAFAKLAEAVGAQPELSGERDELLKLADVIAELDQAAGLERHYGKRLPDPLESVFNTEKIADDMVELAGRQVPLQTLLQIDPEIYKDVFGEDLAEEFIQGGAINPSMFKVILATVPLDLQRVLASQLAL